MSIQHKKVKQKLEEKKSLTFLYKKKYDFISKALGETKLYSIDELINLGLPVFQLSEEPCYFSIVREIYWEEDSYRITGNKWWLNHQYTSNYGGQVLNIIVNYNNNTFVFPVLIYLGYYSTGYVEKHGIKNKNGKYTITKIYKETWSFPPTEPYLFYIGTKPRSFKFLYFNNRKNEIIEIEGTRDPVSIYELFSYIWYDQRNGSGWVRRSPYLKLISIL